MPIVELDGRAIKIGRVVKGWTQRQLGAATGLKPWRIWALENNVYTPRTEEWSKIWHALSSGPSGE
jgi:ribosome-binding protein aMBF1 (putative translation factor)